MSQVPRYRKSICRPRSTISDREAKAYNKDFWGNSNKCVPLIYTNRCTHCSISRSTLAISEKSLESIIFLKKLSVGLLRIVTTAFKLFLYIDWYNLDTNTFSYNVHFLINYDGYLSGTHCDPKELLSILQIFTFWKGPYAWIFSCFLFGNILVKKSSMMMKNVLYYYKKNCCIVKTLIFWQ